jgi:hypothetical protein
MAKKRFKQAECPNCGAHYVDEQKNVHFCPGCGQENHDVNVPLRHLVAEAAEGLLHFDSKTMRTLGTLALKPGLLTKEFLSGRRARYVAPMRLYIFVSFLFFLILAFFSGQAETLPRASSSERREIRITYSGVSASELRDVKDEQIEAFVRARGLANTSLNRYAMGQMARIGRGGQETIRHLILKSLSSMMFVLMPVYGVLLYFVFRKRAPHYIAALIFSLHYHSFAFLVLGLLSIASGLLHQELFLLLLPIVLAVYQYLAFRTAYGCSAPGALAKTLVIGILHAAAIVLLFCAVLLVRVLLF